MDETTETGRKAVIVNLAVYREGRAKTRRLADAQGRRLIALKLPSPRALAHRRRMLEVAEKASTLKLEARN